MVWLALDPSRISRKARTVIEQARRRGDGIAISSITLLEIATIQSKGRIELHTSLEAFLTEIEARFIVLPITGRICVRALGLPAAYPKDPGDRVIAATALVEGIPLITADKDIQQSKVVHAIW